MLFKYFKLHENYTRSNMNYLEEFFLYKNVNMTCTKENLQFNYFHFVRSSYVNIGNISNS